MSLERLAHFRRRVDKGVDATAVILACAAIVTFSNSTYRARVEARAPNEDKYEELVIHDTRNTVAAFALHRASMYQKKGKIELTHKELATARETYISMKLECPDPNSEYGKLCRQRFNSRILSTYFPE